LFAQKGGIRLPVNYHALIEGGVFLSGTVPGIRAGFEDQEGDFVPMAFSRENSFEQIFFPYYLAGNSDKSLPFTINAANLYRFFSLVLGSEKIGASVRLPKEFRKRDLLVTPIEFCPGVRGAEIVPKDEGFPALRVVMFAGGKFVTQLDDFSFEPWSLDRIFRIRNGLEPTRLDTLSELMALFSYLSDGERTMDEIWTKLIQANERLLEETDPLSKDCYVALQVILGCLKKPAQAQKVLSFLHRSGDLIPLFKLFAGINFSEGDHRRITLADSRLLRVRIAEFVDTNPSAKKVSEIIQSFCLEEPKEGAEVIPLWAAPSSRKQRAAVTMERARALARKFDWKSMDVDDREGATMVGLAISINQFDPNRGVPFAAYASGVMRNVLLQEIQKTADDVRKPAWVHRLMPLLKSEFKNCRKPPSEEDLISFYERNKDIMVGSKPLKKVVLRELFVQLMRDYWTLDHTRLDLEPDDNKPVAERFSIGAKSEDEFLDLLDRRRELEKLYRGIAGLSPGQRRVFELRYGLAHDQSDYSNGKKGEAFLSWRTIGQVVGLSGSRALQIEEEARRRIVEGRDKPTKEMDVSLLLPIRLTDQEKMLCRLTYVSWVSDKRAEELMGISNVAQMRRTLDTRLRLLRERRRW